MYSGERHRWGGRPTSSFPGCHSLTAARTQTTIPDDTAARGCHEPTGSNRNRTQASLHRRPNRPARLSAAWPVFKSRRCRSLSAFDTRPRGPRQPPPEVRSA
jgi:hypothetical protein